MDISSDAHPKKTINVLGKKMAYVEIGDPNGRPIIFQHGNPTSSYLWRNIMPYAATLGRCIALDLIGMGDSDRLDDSGPESYGFVEHSRYFEAALEALSATDNMVLVIHDWGQHWALIMPRDTLKRWRVFAIYGSHCPPDCQLG